MFNSYVCLPEGRFYVWFIETLMFVGQWIHCLYISMYLLAVPHILANYIPCWSLKRPSLTAQINHQLPIWLIKKKQLRCMFESKLWCMPVPRKLSYTVIDMEKWPPRMPDFLMEWQRKVAPLRCPQHPSALLLIFSSKIHRKSTKFCSEDFMMAKTMPFLWPFAPSSHRHF